MTKNMRNYLSTWLLALVLSTCWSCRSDESPQPTAQPKERPNLVTQVQKCARLYTTEYHIHKIVTHDDVLRLKGSLLARDFNIALPLGERKIAIPMDATLKAYIDFSQFSEENVERRGSQLVILLPDPQMMLTSSKINQQEIREYVGIVRSHFTDREMTAYEQQGREAILQSIDGADLLSDAQANAARVLVPMLTEMGYREEDIIITFRHDLDFRKLINLNTERK